jgi:hypothetical protein
MDGDGRCRTVARGFFATIFYNDVISSRIETPSFNLYFAKSHIRSNTTFYFHLIQHKNTITPPNFFLPLPSGSHRPGFGPLLVRHIYRSNVKSTMSYIHFTN